MKNIILLIFAILSNYLLAQKQLEIQGDPSSPDTVALIKVNYDGFSSNEPIGLVVTTPEAILFKGIAASFQGNRLGISTRSNSGTALLAQSQSGTGLVARSISGQGIIGINQLDTNFYYYFTDRFGVMGFSDDSIGVLGISSQFGVLGRVVSELGRAVKGKASGVNSIGVMGVANEANSTGVWGDGYTGGFFKGSDGTAIQLGGAKTNYSNPTEEDDDCVIRSQKNQTHGDFILVTNDEMAIRLDDDGNSTAHFKVFNGDSTQIFSLDESGNLTITGTYSPSSDVNRKERFTSIDIQDILAKVASLPISEWQFKGEKARHIGPMAQDFYAAFGLGQNTTTIATVDADGVALAAIQAQQDLILELTKKNQILEEEIKDIQPKLKEVDDLKLRIEKLEMLIRE